MKKLFVTIIAGIALTTMTYAQTARVMAIHNSADPAVDTVDVYLLANNTVAAKIENLGFRASTGFINVPASTPIRLAFAGKNSLSVADTLIGFGFNLTPNETYVLLAQGHVGNGFTPQKDFKLHVVAPAKERNTTGGDTSVVAIVHGATDAPNVDILIRKGNNEVAFLEGVGYDSNSGYLPLKEDNYLVDITVDEFTQVTFAAPLKTLNTGDSALVVFASGFLNPTANNNGKAFGLFAALSNGTVLPLPVVPTFRLQAFHNCGDPVADTVDVWLINRTTNVNTRLIPNFIFRKATPFIDAPANQNIAIGLTLPGAPLADTVYVEDLGLVPGGFTAIAIASGVLDPSKFEANPNGRPISFEVVGISALEKSPEAGKVAVNVFHGATDAPAVDVIARGVGKLVENLSYGDNENDYLIVDPQTYTLDIAAAGTSSIVASYTAPLTAYRDSALVVFASGFLSPNTPTGKDAGPAFALIAVTPSGQTISLPTVTTGLSNISTTIEGLSVYPNPVRDVLTLSLPEKPSTNYTVTIADMSGKVVVEEVLTNMVHTVNTSDLSKGMYFVTVGNNTQRSFHKIVVE